MKQRNQIDAFLGADTDFEGKLSFKGSVRVDGRFKGEILTDGTLIVGESASLESIITGTHDPVQSPASHRSSLATNQGCPPLILAEETHSR